ncbi:Hint domain-containing protein [Acetobacter orleanensis]|uniref:Hedgehog/Intein (Hint) domain-containing protein n=1 Tax=Acetobacter orleanensis TaxID=104099 RepID=A0A4Y3TML3_9PROT|nr:Hint domain-containing protein [Acetobacter orleanensis]KXV65205.1 hypothetical protein AD949_04860 [Acetobacter orleanensis]PCD79653.1 hypothetical protein CO710_05450 [Acetobacter orleanensis]GAN68759.1 outer membrane protein/adhesin family protein [Acetobacter orleanensis JCM 7639]GBR28047.1 hypothetical protein AA0473_1622 [Acetobacter orleanensis NRIC 0473]GEB82267.1 hypothetical protein AOR01nite_07440 [Acetobacter orleanensis]
MTDYKTDSGVVYSVAVSGTDFFGNPSSYSIKITDPDGKVTNLGNLDVGQVVAKNGQSLTVGSFLGIGGNICVVPATLTGQISIAFNTLSSMTIYVGGTATITTSLSGLSTTTVNVDGGNATLGNNQLVGAFSGSVINLTNSGTFSNGNGLIGLLTGMTINFGKGGGNFVANAGGTILDLSTTTINGFNAAKDFISFENLKAAPATYSISNSSGSQVITVSDASGAKIADVTIAGQSFAAGKYSTTGAGPLTVSSNGSSLSIEAVASVCFLAGTQLHTPGGVVAVEDIQVGDSLLTFENGQAVTQPVVWVGSRQAEVRPGLPLDEAGWPVRVCAGALDEGVPNKDLLITSEHCLYFDGQFVPVRMLVNGRTIAYDQSMRSYTYYHVETAQHAVIMADGALTESYLDTGNRSSFQQAGTVVRLPGLARCWAKDAAAPLVTAREVVEPLYQRLALRAETLAAQGTAPETQQVSVGMQAEAPAFTSEANLHLVTENGEVLRQARMHKGHVVFMVPPHVQTVRLVSRISRPVDTVGPFVDDRRKLGVLVGRIALQEGAAESRLLEPATGTVIGSGWHEAEAGQTARWTNGNAGLSLGARQPEAFGLLFVEVLAGGPYLVSAPSAVRLSVG